MGKQPWILSGVAVVVLTTTATIGMAEEGSPVAAPAEVEPSTAPETDDSPTAEEIRHEDAKRRIAQRLDAVCEHVVQCALEGLPESVRQMMDRSQICRQYQRYLHQPDGSYDQRCVDAVIRYLDCVEGTECAEFKQEQTSTICGQQQEDARKMCQTDD